MFAIKPQYPAGLAGVGLFLLRVAVLVWVVAGNWNPGQTTLQVALLTLALLLVVGFKTAPVALLCAAIGLLHIAGGTAPATDLPGLLASLCLSCVGAGAFSIDAHLFGRRTIELS